MTIAESLIECFFDHFGEHIKDKESARRAFVCGMISVFDGEDTIVKHCQGHRQIAEEKLDEFKQDVIRLYQEFTK